MFSKSHTALTVFRVEADPKATEEFSSALADRLSEALFQSIDDTPEITASSGFVPYGFDFTSAPDFSKGSPFCEPYAAWKLRQDTRKVPPALLKKEMAMAVYRELQRRKKEAEDEGGLVNPEPGEEKGIGTMSRERRKELRMEVKDRLLQEAAPIPGLADVVWAYNGPDGYIYLTSKTPAAKKALALHLEKAAPGVELIEITPSGLADAAGLDTYEDVGVAFLTYLAKLAPGDHLEAGGAEVSIGGKIVLSAKSSTAAPERITASGDPETGMVGARAELQAGRKCIQAEIVVHRGEDKWTMTVRGQDFRLTEFRCPDVELDKGDAKDAMRVLDAKMPLVEEGVGYLYGAFRAYCLNTYKADDQGREAA